MSAKPWPKYGDKGYTKYDPCGSLGDEVFDAEKFERARYEAAIERLRIAVEALESLGQSLGCKYGNGTASVSELLAAIGDLPEEKS